MTAPVSTTTLYVYDLYDHVIAETDTNGSTQREYIWLNDMPVAVVDQVASGSPVVYYVHTDHLNRPARMTAANGSWAWDVIYSPFGAVSYVYTNPEVMNAQFPGQWFQLETGLAYNWHRHYDPTLGRYIQPDPMGLTALLSDGPSAYNYAGQSPLVKIDPTGQFVFVFAIPAIVEAVEFTGGFYGGVKLGELIGNVVASKSLENDKSIASTTTNDCPTDDKDFCLKQYESDMKYCGSKYSFSSSAYRGCIRRASTNLEKCLKGEPELSPWKDIDVDGWQAPSPKRNR